MAVAPATVLAHYIPSTYMEPELFRPERIIEHSYSAFEYMPFGSGHRRCIGTAFATDEMSIVHGTILKRYQLELVDSNLVVPKRRFGTNLKACRLADKPLAKTEVSTGLDALSTSEKQKKKAK